MGTLGCSGNLCGYIRKLKFSCLSCISGSKNSFSVYRDSRINIPPHGHREAADFRFN